MQLESEVGEVEQDLVSGVYSNGPLTVPVVGVVTGVVGRLDNTTALSQVTTTD